MSNTYTGAQIKPTAEVGADVGRIVVNVGEGWYEIYIDQKMKQPALHNGQTESYPAAPGVHRVGVYCAGRWVIDTDVEVPEAVMENHEQPAGEPEATVSVKVSMIRDLIAEMRDIADMLEAGLPKEGA